MGDIGGMLGLSGGAGGSGFSAPAAAQTVNPTSADQLNTAYGGVQNSMQSQQALLAALQAQNGLNNQSQVYSQLQGVANGTGPNPAQAMLNQSTSQNVVNQAALMAGQRGAGANVGLIARQAAQQGANTQQQAAGQAATLQANQSLNAINAAGSMANTQAANQVGQTNANAQAQQAEQSSLINAQNAYNQAQVGMQSNINAGNTQLANTQMQGGQALIGGVINSGVGALLGAEGGKVTPKGFMADGGNVAVTPEGPQSKFGQFLSSVNSGAPMDTSLQINTNNPGSAAISGAFANLQKKIGGGTPMSPNATVGTSDAAGGANLAGGAMDAGGLADLAPMVLAARGGKVSAMLSPGEKYLNPQEAKAVAQGSANPAQVGKIVPGTPKFKGNNYANDVVPAKLEEGGFVIPNAIMQSKDPARGAADFVRKAMAKKKVKK